MEKIIFNSPTWGELTTATLAKKIGAKDYENDPKETQ